MTCTHRGKGWFIVAQACGTLCDSATSSRTKTPRSGRFALSGNTLSLFIGTVTGIIMTDPLFIATDDPIITIDNDIITVVGHITCTDKEITNTYDEITKTLHHPPHTNNDIFTSASLFHELGSVLAYRNRMSPHRNVRGHPASARWRFTPFRLSMLALHCARLGRWYLWPRGAEPQAPHGHLWRQHARVY